MMFQSFLFVDAGNTRVKWAIADIPGRNSSRPFDSRKAMPLVQGEMPMVDATPDCIRKLKKSFSGHFLILASVVPRLTLDFCRTFKRGFYSLTAESRALGLDFDYPNPAEIGADRLASAVAAHEAGKWPVIVVSSGTATAFTVLDAKGRLCGGAIAPGLQVQLGSLLDATAQLPATKLRQPNSALAKSTQAAIRAGVMLNFQGGVKEIVHQLSDSLPGRKKPHIILTGGNAHYLTGSLGLPYTLRPLLVFEGLRIIGNRLYALGLD
jgi:type III pantothenate kinase